MDYTDIITELQSHLEVKLAEQAAAQTTMDELLNDAIVQKIVEYNNAQSVLATANYGVETTQSDIARYEFLASQ